MRWQDAKALAARWWVTLAVLLFLAAYFGWWRIFPDPLTRLFRALPAGQGLYLYADLKGLRTAPALRTMLESPESPFGNLRSLLAETSFLDDMETEGLALSMSGPRIRLVAQGGISQSRLQAFVEKQGGDCNDARSHETCRVRVGTPARELTLEMVDDDLLAASYEKHSGDVSDHSEEVAGTLAPIVRTQALDGALLWCAMQPSQIEEISDALPTGVVNLAFFARALKDAERVYLWIEREDVAASFSLLLVAETASADDSAELNSLLLSLNRFAAAAADTGRGDSPSEWGQVLRSGEFSQMQESVQAIWRLGPLLRRGPNN